MNVQIPDHIKAINTYQIGKPVSKLQEEYGWEKVSILWNNENTLGYSPKSKKAVINAYESINYYPDPASLDLKKVLSNRLGKAENEIILANGSESVLMLAIRAMCAGNDEFLTSAGGFVVCHNWARINNVPYMDTPMTTDYGIDLEVIKKRITRNTKIIYLANCNNPTGTSITELILDRFMKSIPDHILVLLDEAYFEYSKAIDPMFLNSMEMNYPNIVTLRTFSKAYGIAGVRLGFGVGHKRIIGAMTKAKLTFEPTSLAQAAGIGALDDETFLKKSIENNTNGLTFFYKEFDRLNINYVKSFGNFVMTIWKDKNEVKQIFEKLMEQGVLVRPLMPPNNHCIRISVGRPDENKHCIDELERIVSQPLKTTIQ